MKKHLKILLTGLFTIVPFAITVWLIWKIGLLLDDMGAGLVLKPIWGIFSLNDKWPLENIHGVGALIVIVVVYLFGLLMHFWLFRGLVSLVEKLFERVPGIKTVYESIRDLMKLFGSDSQKKMGRVVEYCPPGTSIGILGILTNEQPSGSGDQDRVAVYFPLAYMIGGPVTFVQREHIREVDMPVEQALRLCAMAQVGGPEEEARAEPGKSKSSPQTDE